MRERDRQNATQRNIEGELHRLELDSTKILSKIKDKENLEKQIEEWKKDIADIADRIKVTSSFLSYDTNSIATSGHRSTHC